MVNLQEQVDAGKQLIEQLIEILHVPSDVRYEKYFHSKHYALHVEYSGTGVRFPDFRIRLTRKLKTFNQGTRSTNGSATLMGYHKSVTDGSMSCGGHGELSEVIHGLEEIHAHYTKVILPVKEIIQKLVPTTAHAEYRFTFDAVDVMVSITGSPSTGYTVNAYRGTISPHPSNVSIKVGLDKDLTVNAEVRLVGELDRIYRTMDIVLEEVRKGTIRFIREEVTDA